MSTDSSNMKIATTRFKNVNSNIKNKIKEMTSFKDINNSTYVMSVRGVKSDKNLNYLAYNKPYSAILFNNLPLKLCVRGTVYNINQDQIIYIPTNKKAIIYNKLKLIAAAILFLAISIYFTYPFIHRSCIITNMEVTQLLNNGYLSIEDLPKEITNKVPELNDNLLFASGGYSDHAAIYENRSKIIKLLIFDLGESFKDDYKLISFYNRIIKNISLNDSVRKCALLKQLKLANELGLKNVIIEYKTHPDNLINQITSQFMHLNNIGDHQ